ncbi:uncharacterized protein [Amphiura filiformis]|uniref:uncharacterized protein n=1 Tax=Amphiura filiformis TaxID=82378 RepID=UPI003B228501
MAASLAEQIHQNFLNCGICLTPFKNPRALPCLHSFCEECLERWAKANKKGKSKVFACPNCMKSTQIPAEGIQGFPAHFLVNSLQETVNMEKIKEDYSEKLCSKCNKPGTNALIYCCNCQHFLCKSCYDSHSPWGPMKHHKVISIDDLASGKVSLPGSDGNNDQYCTEHDGEENKFYCKTCGKLVCRDCIIMKQCCRDHDYVTLKELSTEKSNQLKELMKTCSQNKKLCQEALEKVKKAKSELSRSVKEVRKDLDMVKKENVWVLKNVYEQQLRGVENVYAQQVKRINHSYEQNKDKLDGVTSNLTAKLQKMNSVYHESQHLVETASHSSIISRYPPVQEMLQEVNQDHTYGEDGELAVIPMPITSMYVVQRWKQCREFKVLNTNRGKHHHGPVGIALTSENKIAIAYYDFIKVFSSSGNQDHCFRHLPYNGDDVAVTSKDGLVYVPMSPLENRYRINVYDRKFQLHKECTISHSIDHAVITIDKNDSVIMGLCDNTTNWISVYDIDNGSETSSFEIQSKPISIALSAPGEIAVVYANNTLQTSDYTGKIIHIFHPPPEAITWVPRCICASKKYEVFVVNQGDPKAIYRYTAGGEYIGCVTTEINDARGIAISHDDQELFVTEYTDHLVKVFKRP